MTETKDREIAEAVNAAADAITTALYSLGVSLDDIAAQGFELKDAEDDELFEFIDDDFENRVARTQC